MGGYIFIPSSLAKRLLHHQICRRAHAKLAKNGLIDTVFFFLLVSHLHPLKKEEEITDKMAKLIVSMDLLRGRVGNGSKGKVHQECAIFTQIPHANRRRLSTKCYSYSRCCICVYGSRIIHSTFFFFFFLFIKAKQFIKIKRIGHGLRHQERLYIYTQRERPTRQLKRVWVSCFFFSSPLSINGTHKRSSTRRNWRWV